MSVWQDPRYLRYHDWLRQLNTLLGKYLEREASIPGIPLLVDLLTNIVNNPEETKYRFIRRIKPVKDYLEINDSTLLVLLGFRLVVVQMESKWSWQPDYGVSLDMLEAGLKLIKEKQASWKDYKEREQATKARIKMEKTEELKRLRIIIEEDRQRRAEQPRPIYHDVPGKPGSNGPMIGYRLNDR